jgi:hypothetical protein
MRPSNPKPDTPRERLADSFIFAVVEEHPAGGYNTPTTVAGGIFSKLISDYLFGNRTSLQDLVEYVQGHSGTPVTTTPRIAMTTVLQHLNTINEAIEQHHRSWLNMSPYDGVYQITFSTSRS